MRLPLVSKAKTSNGNFTQHETIDTSALPPMPSTMSRLGRIGVGRSGTTTAVLIKSKQSNPQESAFRARSSSPARLIPRSSTLRDLSVSPTKSSFKNSSSPSILGISPAISETDSLHEKFIENQTSEEISHKILVLPVLSQFKSLFTITDVNFDNFDILEVFGKFYNQYGFPINITLTTKEQQISVLSNYSFIAKQSFSRWELLLKNLKSKKKLKKELPKKSDSVKELVRLGIPRHLRRIVWLHYSGASLRMESNPGLYTALLARENQQNQQKNLGGSSDINEHIEVIERDLQRTFPDNLYFCKQDGIERLEALRSLRNVLVAFSFHNSDIGYCQSMNFLVGLLLLFMTEEEAFWMLVVITDDIMPPGMYSKTLSGTVTEMRVFRTIVIDKCKKLLEKVHSGGIVDIDMLVGPWFMTLFINVLPCECVLRIWDCMFYEGSKILYRAAIAILKIMESELLHIKDPMELVQKIQKGPRNLQDPELLMKKCFQRFGSGAVGSLSQRSIDKRREHHSRRISSGSSETDKSSSGKSWKNLKDSNSSVSFKKTENDDKAR